jgi:hypothetical protein
MRPRCHVRSSAHACRSCVSQNGGSAAAGNSLVSPDLSSWDSGSSHLMDTVTLWHGTTESAAKLITSEGFGQADTIGLVEATAAECGADPAGTLAALRAAHRFVLLQDGRDDVVWFATNRARAGRSGRLRRGGRHCGASGGPQMAVTMPCRRPGLTLLLPGTPSTSTVTRLRCSKSAFQCLACKTATRLRSLSGGRRSSPGAPRRSALLTQSRLNGSPVTRSLRGRSILSRLLGYSALR